jgi:methyl-accepting chemotaxis protein-1 (serine sensor receptor)
MGEIACAGREQESGIGQINLAISQMDSVTQMNSALVEEAAAATHSLHEQADQLARVVGVFKLEPMEAATSGAPSGAAAMASALAAARATAEAQASRRRSSGSALTVARKAAKKPNPLHVVPDESASFDEIPGDEWRVRAA